MLVFLSTTLVVEAHGAMNESFAQSPQAFVGSLFKLILSGSAFEGGEVDVDVEGGDEVLDFGAGLGVAGVEVFNLEGEAFFVFAFDNVEGLLGAFDAFGGGFDGLLGDDEVVVGTANLQVNLLGEFVPLGFEFALFEFALLGAGAFLEAVEEVPAQEDRCHPVVVIAIEFIGFAFKAVVIDKVDGGQVIGLGEFDGLLGGAYGVLKLVKFVAVRLGSLLGNTLWPRS